MMKRGILLLIAVGTLAIGCSRKEAVKATSIDAIQADNGVPVKALRLEERYFAKTQSFNANVSGYKQATIHSAITDEVKEVRVKVGDYVKKDQIIVVFPEDNPAAQYRQLRDQVANVEKNYFRMKNLFETGGISRQSFEEIETTYSIYKANLEAVEDMIFVKAPMSGIVTELNAFVDNTINAENPIATISKLNKLRTKIDIADTNIALYKTGMKVTANWNGNETEGKITRIAMAMNPMTKSFVADVELDNEDKAISAGVSITLEAIVYSNDNAIVIPKKVLQTSKNGSNYVWISVNDKAVKRDIKIKEETSMYAEIESGLNSGDLLLVEGYKLLKENSLVSIVK